MTQIHLFFCFVHQKSDVGCVRSVQNLIRSGLDEIPIGRNEFSAVKGFELGLAARQDRSVFFLLKQNEVAMNQFLK